MLAAVAVAAAAAIGIRAGMLGPESDAPRGVAPVPSLADAGAGGVTAQETDVPERSDVSVAAFADAAAGVSASVDVPEVRAHGIRPPGVTRTIDSDRRVVSARTGRVSDPPAGAPTADAGSTGVDPRAAALRARRDALTASLRTRHLTRADLPAPLRARLAELDRAIDASHSDDATRLLGELEPTVAAVRVDAAFVRRKLDRVGARIAAARRRGANTRELEELAAAALQGFLDGRLDETNRRLDEIEVRLP